MEAPSQMRVDKWLWAVRVFKTRSQAIAACHAGHVKVGGQPLKPSREVRVGDVLEAYASRVQRTVRVRALLDHRVGPPLVSQFLEDLTPPAAYERARAEARATVAHFPRGWGRPTKKDRRQLDALLDPPPS